MSFKRVPPYKVFEVLKGGARRRLDVRDIVVEVRPGVEIEINFAPHPNFAGHLVLYTPPCRRMRKVFDAGIVDDFAVFFGATNVLHVRQSNAPSKETSAADKESEREALTCGDAL